jgi:hypothetical protein
VFIDGFEVTPMPPQRRDVAFAFQQPALYPHLRVWENIAYPMRAQSIPRNVIDRRVNEVIDRLRLNDLRDRKPRKLSPSERQTRSASAVRWSAIARRSCSTSPWPRSPVIIAITCAAASSAPSTKSCAARRSSRPATRSTPS